MHDLVRPLVDVLEYALQLFWWAVIANIVMSWLVSFNIINTHNRVVYVIWDALNRITEPALRPIRRIMPNTGALDLSPIVLFFIIYLIQDYLRVFANDL
jgi:YggT family protein